ncbi:MAG: hypothetical protein DRI22_01575 [Caldiserica bacterium]|nr:MAG: hypothetical protein DRI22_01575 [Caldisericota bacterium]
MSIGKLIFNFLIYPGFIFVLLVGGIASFLERKITARIQWRVGPPFLQPFYDLLKLFFVKETVIPKGVNIPFFILVPVIAFSSAVLTSVLITNIFIKSFQGFTADLIVIVYLFTIPSLCVIFAGAVSKNPLSSLGSSREMKLILSYELVFWTSLSIVIIKTGGKITLRDILTFQENSKPIVFSLSGFIAFILSLIVMQAKLGKVPFDIAEAEQELIAGPYIEYSGALLGFFKVTHYILLFSLPAFISVLFLGGLNIFKYLLLLIFIIVFENTNPRLKITQAIRFFWFYLFPLGIIGIILAIKGL